MHDTRQDTPEGGTAGAASATDGGPPVGGLAALRDLLGRNRDFRLLFFASVVSYLGDWFALVAVSGLVAETTGSEGSTALVLAVEVLPVFLLAPVAGVLADRFDRKRIMLGSALGRAVPASLLVVAAFTEQAWLAFVGVAGIAALAAFYEPIAPAVLPNVVDEEDLDTATAATATVWGTMLFIGAGIGGLVTALIGREATLVVNACTFLVAAGLLRLVRAPFSEGGEVQAAASVLGEARQIWQFVAPRKPVKALMITKAAIGVGNGVVGLLPVYAVDRFGAGDAGIGVLLAARGLGVLVGPLIGRRILARGDGRWLLRTNAVAITAYGVGYLLLPAAPNLATGLAIVFCAHLGGGHNWVASTLGLQKAVPDRIRARVMTLDFAMVTLAIGVSSLGAAGLADRFGITVTTTVLAGVATAFGLAWGWWTRDLWRGDVDPLVVDHDER